MILDTAIRSAAVAILGLLALTTWRKGGTLQRTLALCWLSAGAYLLHSSPPFAALMGPFRVAAVALAAVGPFFFFYAARLAFGEPPWPSRPAAAALVTGLLLLGLTPEFLAHAPRTASAIERASDIATFALFAAAVYAAWTGLADDLDPLRRSRRLQLLGLGLIVGLAIAASALASSAGADLAWTRILFAGAILFVATAYAVNGFVLESEEVLPSAEPRPTVAAGPDDGVLIAKIRQAFAQDKLHRRDGLTLAALARHLDVPEYLVRRAINRGLGFKNFSAFVNEHRLGEVKQALCDPGQGGVPISTIALDAGYGSLATFNRTFKEATGLSPSEFRRRAQTS